MMLKRAVPSFIIILTLLFLAAGCSQPVGQATTYSGSNSVTAAVDGSFSYAITITAASPFIVYKSLFLGIKDSSGEVSSVGSVGLQGGEISTVHADWRVGALTATITNNDVTPGSDGKVYLRFWHVHL